MYKFNYMDVQPPTSATQQLDAHIRNQNNSAANLTIPLANEADYSFDELDLSMSVEPQSFNDAASFSKSSQLFNLIPYTADDWSSSSPTDSVYPSPIDCFGSTSYAIPILDGPVDGHHMLPPPALTSFSHNGLSSYVRTQ